MVESRCSRAYANTAVGGEGVLESRRDLSTGEGEGAGWPLLEGEAGGRMLRDLQTERRVWPPERGVGFWESIGKQQKGHVTPSL